MSCRFPSTWSLIAPVLRGFCTALLVEKCTFPGDNHTKPFRVSFFTSNVLPSLYSRSFYGSGISPCGPLPPSLRAPLQLPILLLVSEFGLDLLRTKFCEHLLKTRAISIKSYPPSLLYPLPRRPSSCSLMKFSPSPLGRTLLQSPVPWNGLCSMLQERPKIVPPLISRASAPPR